MAWWQLAADLVAQGKKLMAQLNSSDLQKVIDAAVAGGVKLALVEDGKVDSGERAAIIGRITGHPDFGALVDAQMVNAAVAKFASDPNKIDDALFAVYGKQKPLLGVIRSIATQVAKRSGGDISPKERSALSEIDECIGWSD